MLRLYIMILRPYIMMLDYIFVNLQGSDYRKYKGLEQIYLFPEILINR